MNTIDSNTRLFVTLQYPIYKHAKKYIIWEFFLILNLKPECTKPAKKINLVRFF